MKRENTHSRIKIHLNLVVIIIKSSMLGTNVGTTPSGRQPRRLESAIAYPPISASRFGR